MRLLPLCLLLTLAAGAQKKDFRWKYIKNEDRLQLVKTNVTRTGTITKIYNERDGDLHIWLKLRDSSMLNVEVICYKPAPECAGYTNTIARPKVGDRVRVVGDYVFDNKHKWYELHPVKKITKID